MIMKRIIVFTVFLSALLACQAQDTVHFTRTQQDTDIYYHPFGVDEYNDWPGGQITVPDYYIYNANYANGHTKLWRLLYRQPCNRPLTVYGIAMASQTEPDTSIRAWMAKPNTNCGSGGYLPVNSFIVDSTDNNYRTRHYHVEGPEYDNLYSCGDKIEGWHDTVLTCYEYYFNQPITVDSDFFIGVFSNKCVLDDGTWGIHYHERKLCQAVLGGYLWFETGIVDSLHNPGGEPVLYILFAMG